MFLDIFLRKVFSDYFLPSNVLYIDRGSHNSANFMPRESLFYFGHQVYR